MKQHLLVILFLLVVSPIYSIQTYYISSSSGSDSNNGLTEKSPLKSISKAPKSNVVIKLKAGDVFYESISDLKNCTVTAYGKGKKPVLSGFKRVKAAKGTQVWTSVGNDVWRIDLSANENFTGFFKVGDYVNDIGVLYCVEKDLVYGHLVNDIKKLKETGDFFITSEWLKKNVKPETFKYLYLKHRGNPGSEGLWSFSSRAYGVYNLSGCHVSNIKVQGFSAHGFWGITNSKIDRCELDLIGGAIQLDTYEWVRFGNGIEFYMDRDLRNCEIRNCYFSRVYDCGATIQLSKNSKTRFKPISIRFIGNVFVNCRQAFEHFLPSDLPYENCEFSDNLILDAGENGFRSPESRDAAFLSYESTDRSDLRITNNKIFGSSFYCGKHYTKNMSGNVVYIYDDQYIASYHFDSSFPKLNAKEGDESIKKYKTISKDNDTEFIVMGRNSFMSSLYRYLFLRKIEHDETVGD